ncbi:hypothetical protein FB45DRAFT_907741 [Roridomyces roridus]|uniref:Uncharacterized protein n=1 Tax=Roridomyces roridus TaxID=1738132 RepID=A0AAD7C3T2_9AGAR|nr:hypothetical protein FB45DRAFT_907741 [Roridomyces roridus]
MHARPSCVTQVLDIETSTRYPLQDIPSPTRRIPFSPIPRIDHSRLRIPEPCQQTAARSRVPSRPLTLCPLAPPLLVFGLHLFLPQNAPTTTNGPTTAMLHLLPMTAYSRLPFPALYQLAVLCSRNAPKTSPDLKSPSLLSTEFPQLSEAPVAFRRSVFAFV